MPVIANNDKDLHAMANKTDKPKQGKTTPDALPKTGYSRWQKLELLQLLLIAMRVWHVLDVWSDLIQIMQSLLNLQ
jgi:hypothetical protein